MNNFAEYFRPKSPKQLIGEKQKILATSLLEKVEKKEIIQTLLICGPSGSGKTTIARMYIQAVLGPNVNIDEKIIYLDKMGVDDIREWKSKMSRPNLFCPYNIYFYDEIHALTNDAQRELLIPLEKLPSHVILIGCTTDPQKLINTLASRFNRHDLSYPDRKDYIWLANAIESALLRDKVISNPFDRQQVEEIITISQGNLREFDTYLQQIVDGSYQKYTNPEEDETSLAYLMFNKNPSISELFKTSEGIKGYQSTVIGIFRYAKKILLNSNGGITAKKAKYAILIFGDGYASEEMNFYRKLVEWHEATNK